MASKFTQVYSKVVGVCSGDEAETRQLALRLVKEHWSERERWYADLVPDPENPYDSDAIQLISDVPTLGRTQLGFVSNSQRTCDFCRTDFDTAPKGDRCPKCGEKETIRRNGLASQLCRAFQEDPHLLFYAEINAITGGPEPNAKPDAKAKSFGANIMIRGYVKKEQRKEE
jgi:hypothetical protein